VAAAAVGRAVARAAGGRAAAATAAAATAGVGTAAAATAEVGTVEMGRVAVEREEAMAPGTATEPVVAVKALEPRERGVEAVMEPETVEELVPLSADMETPPALPAARMAA